MKTLLESIARWFRRGQVAQWEAERQQRHALCNEYVRQYKVSQLYPPALKKQESPNDAAR